MLKRREALLLAAVLTVIFSLVRYTYLDPDTQVTSFDTCASSTEELLITLSDSSNCSTQKLLSRLYDIYVSQDHVIVPEPMVQIVRDEWFEKDEHLYNMFKNPRTMVVTDRYTLETSHFNPIRSLRPKPKGGSQGLEEILKIIENARPGCNFCVTTKTLEDSFGRVRWEKDNIFTAENAFRIYDFSGLVIPADIHNFMEIKYETFENMLAKVAVSWFENIHNLHPDRTHPILIWDILPKAGASQVHPHIHTMLGRGYYPGKWGIMDKAKERYATETGGDYLQDMVDLHISLGLGMRFKSAAVIVTINPVKDREIWVIGTDNMTDWTRLYYLAYRTYIELEIYCFSMAMALPSSFISKKMHHGGELLVAKIGARGDCSSTFNDVSSLELYSTSSISSDYYETMTAFRKTFAKFKYKIDNI